MEFVLRHTFDPRLTELKAQKDELRSQLDKHIEKVPKHQHFYLSAVLHF